MALRSTRNSNNKNIRIQRPANLSPWAIPESAEKRNGTVWISMKPKKIVDQLSKGQGTIGTVELNTEFLFQAPLTLNENIVHHWEAYESVASRLAQKARSLAKLGAEGSALYKSAMNQISDTNMKSFFEKSGASEGQAVEKYVTKAYGAVQGSRIPNIKVDTPLYYANSDRRQIVFEFHLFNENIQGTKQEDILIKPIQDLMKFSSPDLLSNIQIEFPYMWEIKTIPTEFIKYTTCALVGVQPTWNAPYVNGFPSSVNLQLTFMDLSPLYAGTIEYGSLVNVVTNKSAETQTKNPQPIPQGKQIQRL